MATFIDRGIITKKVNSTVTLNNSNKIAYTAPTSANFLYSIFYDVKVISGAFDPENFFPNLTGYFKNIGGFDFIFVMSDSNINMDTTSSIIDTDNSINFNKGFVLKRADQIAMGNANIVGNIVMEIKVLEFYANQ